MISYHIHKILFKSYWSTSFCLDYYFHSGGLPLPPFILLREIISQAYLMNKSSGAGNEIRTRIYCSEDSRANLYTIPANSGGLFYIVTTAGWKSYFASSIAFPLCHISRQASRTSKSRW